MVYEVFSRLKSEVIEPGLCTHCGTCVGLSSGSLSMLQTPSGPLPSPLDADAVSLPALAYQTCPGKGLNYPVLNRFVFQRTPANWLVGCEQGFFVGHVTNERIRREAASGGVITQSLVYLLRSGEVDGAIVLAHGTPEPFLSSPIIATTVGEIRAAAQSVYIPIPVNSILEEISAFEGRLAYVGLPDQVASIRALQNLGHPAAKKIHYIMGLYMGTAMYMEAIKSFLRSQGKAGFDEITFLRYRQGEWPGHLKIDLQSGETLRVRKFYYNYLIPFYITRASLLSVDFTNELADLSVGDAWSPQFEKRGEGFSIVAARSDRGRDLLEKLRTARLLQLEKISVEKAISMHAHMYDFKKRGAFIRLCWRRALGLRAPTYGYEPEQIAFLRKVVEFVVSGLFVICGTTVVRRGMGRIPFRVLGPIFDFLRKAWKAVSKPAKRSKLIEQGFRVLTESQEG